MSEEKKISHNEADGLSEDAQGGLDRNSWFSLPNLFALLVLNWQWFLLSFIICISASLVYLRYATPMYKVSGRLLVKDENQHSNATQMLANMQDLGFLSNSTGIDNEVEVLQSRVLLRDVVKDLKLYAEYKREGRVKDVLVYANQPVSVDLDPLHLDSLDMVLLDEKRQISLRMHQDGKGGIEVAGVLLKDGKETSAFMHRFDSLPATCKTNYGTLTFTCQTDSEALTKEVEWLVTITPPMTIATNYLSRLTVAPMSKKTSIAELSLNDQNVRRGLDFISQLAVCYNRQANADKNEIALRTEEFINDRMAKINDELGLSDSRIESIKRSSGVTTLTDASQSVQMSNQFSARLSEANSQVQMLDYLREYVNDPEHRYDIIPSNVGLTDAASVSLINNYNQAVQDRNRLLKAASTEAPQVRTLTATIDELQSSIQTALMQARRSADINRQAIQSQYSMFKGQVSNAPLTERVLNQVGRHHCSRTGYRLRAASPRSPSGGRERKADG